MALQPQNAEIVCKEIVAHIEKQGGPTSNWYIGITGDWDRRLFADHQVPRQNHWYIVRQCHSCADARLVERALLGQGFDGGPCGGDDSTVYVYAYLKALGKTKP